MGGLAAKSAFASGRAFCLDPPLGTSLAWVIRVTEWFDNTGILTQTGGFLKTGYTHTLNPYLGCAFAGSLCGVFCYAQHNAWITKGRPWGFYAAKKHIESAYHRDYQRIRSRGSGAIRPIRIYMSSSTDPYIPQERQLLRTRAALGAMLEQPPDVLVIQTHGALILRDMDLIEALSSRCKLWVSITVETDMDPVPGFPRHAASPVERMKALRAFKDCGVRAQATLSPLLPLKDMDSFAHQLDRVCHRVVIDHYLLGDGSNGLRTKKTDFETRLERGGYGDWTCLAKMWEVKDFLCSVLGHERVLVSREGFNTVP